jgi:hypothetical protein
MRAFVPKGYLTIPSIVPKNPLFAMLRLINNPIEKVWGDLT